MEDALAFDDDYILIDCPGQIELYTHLPLMRQLVQHLQSLDYKVVALYLLDAQFIGKVAIFALSLGLYCDSILPLCGLEMAAVSTARAALTAALLL